jgi:hypothetical protein
MQNPIKIRWNENKNKHLFIVYFLLIIFFSVYEIVLPGFANYISNLNWIYFFPFALSCYISGFSPFITYKNSKFGLAKEWSDELSFEKNVYTKEEFGSLVVLFICALIFMAIPSWSLLLSSLTLIFIVCAFLIKQMDFNRIFMFFLRYLLEVPKLLFIMLILNKRPEIFAILLIISIGSILFGILPRGLFLFEIFLTLLLGAIYYQPQEIVLFILFARVIGATVFLAPYIIFKSIESIPEHIEK